MLLVTPFFSCVAFSKWDFEAVMSSGAPFSRDQMLKLLVVPLAKRTIPKVAKLAVESV